MDKRTLGMAALALSTLLWLAIFVLPWAPLDGGTKFGVGIGLYGLSYVAFFAGGALVGPAAMRSLKARVRSAFRRRDPDPATIEAVHEPDPLGEVLGEPLGEET